MHGSNTHPLGSVWARDSGLGNDKKEAGPDKGAVDKPRGPKPQPRHGNIAET